jgi:hypothetical protein
LYAAYGKMGGMLWRPWEEWHIAVVGAAATTARQISYLEHLPMVSQATKRKAGT